MINQLYLRFLNFPPLFRWRFVWFRTFIFSPASSSVSILLCNNSWVTSLSAKTSNTVRRIQVKNFKLSYFFIYFKVLTILWYVNVDCKSCRAVASWGAGEQTVNPISTRGAGYTHHSTTSSPPPRIFRPCDGPVQKSIEHFVFRPKMVIFWRAGMTVFRLFYEMKLQTSKFKVLPFWSQKRYHNQIWITSSSYHKN